MYRSSTLLACTNESIIVNQRMMSVSINFLESMKTAQFLKDLDSTHISNKYSVSLHFEHLIGNSPFPIIDVYFNAVDQTNPDKKSYVGSLALYGLPDSSDPSNNHNGSGQHQVIDIRLSFMKTLRQANWFNEEFILTLAINQKLTEDTRLTIGRIALYWNEK